MQQPVPVKDEQLIIDREHLRLLALVHYITGSLTAMTSCVFMLYILMGLGMLAAGTATGESSARFGCLLFTGMGGGAMAIGWLFGGLTIYSGRCIAQRKNRTFSAIMAGLNCLNLPLGTLLGIFTLMTLFRNSVNDLYSEKKLLETTGSIPGGEGPQLLTGKIGSNVLTTSQAPALSTDSYHSDSEEQMWQELEKQHREQTASEPKSDL